MVVVRYSRNCFVIYILCSFGKYEIGERNHLFTELPMVYFRKYIGDARNVIAFVDGRLLGFLFLVCVDKDKFWGVIPLDYHSVSDDGFWKIKWMDLEEKCRLYY